MERRLVFTNRNKVLFCDPTEKKFTQTNKLSCMAFFTFNFWCVGFAEDLLAGNLFFQSRGKILKKGYDNKNIFVNYVYVYSQLLSNTN